MNAGELREALRDVPDLTDVRVAVADTGTLEPATLSVVRNKLVLSAGGPAKDRRPEGGTGR